MLHVFLFFSIYTSLVSSLSSLLHGVCYIFFYFLLSSFSLLVFFSSYGGDDEDVDSGKKGSRVVVAAVDGESLAPLGIFSVISIRYNHVVEEELVSGVCVFTSRLTRVDVASTMLLRRRSCFAMGA